MEIVRNLDKSVWRDFVQEHPQGNIYHTPEMHEVLLQTRRHRPTLWAVLGSDRRVLALMQPTQIALMKGFLRHFTARAVVYGGVLAACDPAAGKAVEALLHEYTQQVESSILFTELRNLSDTHHLRPHLGACGFAYDEHLNFLVNLDNREETVWGNISRSGRQRIRAAQKKGLVGEEVTDRKQLKLAYHLLRQTYDHAQIPLASLSLFEAAFDTLAARGLLKIFVARQDCHFVSARFLLTHKKRIIDWYAGSDRAFSSCSPNEFLVWHCLQWGMKHDFQIFDFGGAGRPDEHYGPRTFKAKFGGALVSYGRYICVHAPIRLKVSQTGYRLLRRFL